MLAGIQHGPDQRLSFFQGHARILEAPICSLCVFVGFEDLKRMGYRNIVVGQHGNTSDHFKSPPNFFYLPGEFQIMIHKQEPIRNADHASSYL